MLVDFHMHTTRSDGYYDPPTLYTMAKEMGLSMIAITDHDELQAYFDVQPYVDDSLRVIPGVEFSATYHNKDVHILAYQFDTANKRFNDYIRFFKEERYNRIIKMVHKLQEAHYDISTEDLYRKFGKDASMGRPHLAQLLIDKGYSTSIGECFDTILHHSSPCYIPKFKAQPEDIIDIIHEAGGVAVLAHPILIENDTYVEELLAMGFDGVEVFHPKHTDADVMRYRRMASDRGMFITGGSDFHGLPGRYPDTLGLFLVEDRQVKDFLRIIGVK